MHGTRRSAHSITECDFMKKNGLSTTHKILKLLALQREKAQYDIPEELKIHYSTVFRQLKKLEKKNLVKVVRTEEARKRGKDKKFFGLTLLGWLTCYGQNILTIEHISNLIVTFKEEIPLVLGKWDYFKKEGVEHIAEKHLLNTMKICEVKHQAEIMKRERIIKRCPRLVPDPVSKYDIEQQVGSERMLAVDITDVFLFFGLTRKYISEYRGIFDPLQLFDEIRLKEVFNRNRQLNFYRTQIGRRIEWSHLDFNLEFSNSILSEHKEYFDYPWQKFFNSEKYNQKLINMLFWKLDRESGSKTPFEKVVNAVFEGDYFSATFEMCKLYEAYNFQSIEEIYNKVFTCIEFLAIERIKNKLRNQTRRITPKQHREKYVKYLRKASLEICSAFQLFEIAFTKTWFLTFGQLTSKITLQEFEKNKDKIKAELLAFTKSLIKENNSELDNIDVSTLANMFKSEKSLNFGELQFWDFVKASKILVQQIQHTKSL